jgi:hypothetical protein
MTAVLPKSDRRAFPDISFGPLHQIPALPWLILAAAMRVIASTGGPAWVPAVIVATMAVLHAFLVTAQRAIEAAAGETRIGELGFAEQLRFSFSVLWRITLLMLAADLLLVQTGFRSLGPSMMAGVDGMAFDQFTDVGKFWSAALAALILLMSVGSEQNGGKVKFLGAVVEFARRWFWFGGATIVLAFVYLGLGWGQGLVRSLIWEFWQTSTSSQSSKNLIYFVFIFSFAMLRLWLTLSILTFGLKQSYIRG